MNQGLVDHVTERYRGTVIEVGIGETTATAERLDEEPALTVVTTDVAPRAVDGPRFVQDDVTEPDIDVYRDATLVYALRPPPELHRPIAAVADRVDADAIVVPFGNDSVAVPYEQVSTSDGTTVLRLETAASRDE